MWEVREQGRIARCTTSGTRQWPDVVHLIHETRGAFDSVGLSVLAKAEARPYSLAMMRIIRIILGFVFIVLGILGLFLPFLQGILFLTIGVFLLASHLPVFGRIFCWLQRKIPVFEGLMERMRQFIHKDWHPPPCPPEEDTRPRN
jgi:hypothetical protein